MFDIGMPEFMVIGLVALVVIGPERLPKVMGQIGRVYRQLRTMSNELLSEARAQWEQGMAEVETVTSTVNTAWQDATTSNATPNLPPPRAQQVRADLEQPATQAAAGPWALAAYHRTNAVEAEPQWSTYPHGPAALPRARSSEYDPAVDDAAGSGGPMLMGAALTEEDAALADYDLPEGPSPEGSVPPATPEALGPIASGTEDLLTQTQPAPPALVPGTNGTHAGDTAALNGSASNGVDGAEDAPEPADRERVIIDLYLHGGIAADAAAAYLNVSEQEFMDWVELARSMQRTK
jgi:sec-independent protein translocase protein TatB